MRTSWRGRGLGLLAAVLAAALPATSIAVLTPTTPAGALPTLPAPSSHGITLTGWSEVALDARLGDAVMQTDAVFGSAMRRSIRVRIYLPAGYAPNRAAPYDVLYLLHGGGGDWTAWINDNEGDLRDLLAGQSASTPTTVASGSTPATAATPTSSSSTRPTATTPTPGSG